MYNYYNFTVTMLDIEPPIWRRFLLPQSASFLDLHKAIQEASGSWQGYHGFEFRKKASVVSQVIAGTPIEDEDGFEDDSPPIPEANTVELDSYFGTKPGTVCIYNYDPGDDWLVSVKNVGVETLHHKFKRSLLDGARAFPHEDCGGTPGYEQCLAVLKITKSKLAADSDAANLLKWLGFPPWPRPPEHATAPWSKGVVYLEDLARIRVVVMDKTGTITRAEPEVTDVVSFPGQRRQGVARGGGRHRIAERAPAGVSRRAPSRGRGHPTGRNFGRAGAHWSGGGEPAGWHDGVCRVPGLLPG